MIVAIFALDHVQALLIAALVLPFLTAVSGTGASAALRGLRPLIFILGFTFLVHLLMTPGPAIFAIGPVRGSRPGLETGIFFCSRLALIVVASSFLTLTTTPMRLADGLESLFAPLKKIRVPVSELALIVTISLRFIPSLMEEAQIILKAQKARGADPGSGNILKRISGLVPLIIPLFVTAFRRADELALAIEARAYNGGHGRTRLKPLRVKRLDMLWLAGGGALIMGLLAIDRVIL